MYFVNHSTLHNMEIRHSFNKHVIYYFFEYKIYLIYFDVFVFFFYLNHFVWGKYALCCEYGANILTRVILTQPFLLDSLSYNTNRVYSLKKCQH